MTVVFVGAHTCLGSEFQDSETETCCERMMQTWTAFCLFCGRPPVQMRPDAPLRNQIEAYIIRANGRLRSMSCWYVVRTEHALCIVNMMDDKNRCTVTACERHGRWAWRLARRSPGIKSVSLTVYHWNSNIWYYTAADDSLHWSSSIISEWGTLAVIVPLSVI